MGFVIHKVGIGAGFLQVLWIPLPILIPPIAPHSLTILSFSILTGSLYSQLKKETFKKNWLHKYFP
jgi:hypothetical protein